MHRYHNESYSSNLVFLNYVSLRVITKCDFHVIWRKYYAKLEVTKSCET